MVSAVQKGWFSYGFDVFDRAGTLVARADLAHRRENAKLAVGGRRYLARHETYRSGRPLQLGRRRREPAYR